jgi:carboxypeptidase C (cathepsin A)
MKSPLELIPPLANLTLNAGLEPPRVSAHWNRPLACLLGLILGTSGIGLSTWAADSGESKPQKDEAASDKKAEKPVPKEEASVTHHSVNIGGQEIAYTATAGNLVIRKEDDPVASIFYVGYTREGVKNPDQRPVTFFYNGGPGSSTIWLHMASFGPRIVETANAKPTGPAPYHVVNNGDSLLDRSDLVFIDAVSTGFSRIVGKGQGTNFWNVDGDVDAFGKFITRYVTLNHRWNSPKFLFGESYGTPRSAALVYDLQQQGMAFNGVVLLSSVLNFETLISPGLDEPLVNILPTYAAIAWFHDKLPRKPDDLKSFLQQARDFAAGDYARALAKGQSRTPDETDAVAAKMHEFTGLSVPFLKEANLRVRPARFRKELLRQEGRTVGRYDGRFLGIDFDNAGEDPASDPSDTAIAGAFTAGLNNYLATELNYTHDTPYKVESSEISFKNWDFKHKLPEYRRFPIPYPIFYVVEDLAQTIRENPSLKVLSANGYFDLATPFFGTERDLNQMELDLSLRGNVRFTYYPSGHMVYLNPEARKAFRADLEKFYDGAAPVAESDAAR